MHERGCTLGCAEEIPEVVQIIPPSCCSSEQIKMFPTELLLRVFGSVTFPLVSDRSLPPDKSMASGRVCLRWQAGDLLIYILSHLADKDSGDRTKLNTQPSKRCIGVDTRGGTVCSR